MGTMRQHDAQDGMILESRNYVEAAAQKIVNDTRPAVGLACWDLQMACECSIKAVLHRKDGKFPHTHDLNELYPLIVKHVPTIKISWTDKMPHHKQAIELRYGTSHAPSLDEFEEIYKSALCIINESVQKTASLGLGNASFLLAYAPWKSAT